MLEFAPTRIGDVSKHVTVGFVGSMATLFTDSGVPLLRGQNVLAGKLNLENLKFVSSETHRKWKKSALLPGDVVLVRVGYPGTAAVIPEGMGDLNAASLVIVRPDPLRADARYLCAALNSPWGRAKIAGLLVGSAQQVLNTQTVADLQVPLPDVATQRRIAHTLSAYDDLVENCERRIRVLDEVARALYREWFVDFRFPAREGRLVPSSLGLLPESWEVKRLEQVCLSVLDGDWIETKDQGGDAYRLLQISNVGVGNFIETGNLRFVTQETFERLRCTEIKPNDILVARMPTPIGRAWLATAMPFRMITAVDVAIVRANHQVVHPLYLSLAWNEESNLRRIATQASGTTRLRVTRRELSGLEFAIPSIETQTRFARLVQPSMEVIKTLRSEIDNLRQTRDLLLPRLLSGQLSVEGAA